VQVKKAFVNLVQLLDDFIITLLVQTNFTIYNIVSLYKSGRFYFK